MPWKVNFEDAIVISERVVETCLYFSIVTVFFERFVVKRWNGSGTQISPKRAEEATKDLNGLIQSRC
jgi:DNA-directed RNA polymerase beta subunit